MEFHGRILRGPLLFPKGCQYEVMDSTLLLKITTDQCDGLPGDLIEAFLRIPKKTVNAQNPRSHRAIDFIVIQKNKDSMPRRLAVEKKQWIETLKKLKDPSFIIAVTSGNRAFLSPITTDIFRDLGISHLLAISGLHFGIIAFLFSYLLGFLLRFFSFAFPNLLLRFRKRVLIAPFIIFALYGFLLFVGQPLSAQRAFLMVTAYILATLIRRHIRPLHAMLYALTILLFFNPSYIENIGFQLSFSAVFGILCVLNNSKAIYNIKSSFLQKIISTLSISLAAGFATFPVLLVHTGQISWISLPANALFVPIFSILFFPLILFASIILRFFPFGESFALYILNSTTQIVQYLADTGPLFLSIPGARSIPGAIPIWVGIALFLIISFVLYNATKIRLPVLLSLIFVAISLVIFTSPRFPNALLVHFIDVGQGDAIFVRTPNGKHFLIDTGGSNYGSDPGQRVTAPYLKKIGVAELDAVLITHHDFDHDGGLPAIQRTLKIKQVVRKKEQATIFINNGFEILQINDTEESKNNRSLVLKFVYGKNCILLSGDIEIEAEERLAPLISTCNILKLPHHGSKTSSSPFFLKHIRPSIAVVSAGRNNRFGHPHPEVIQRIQENNIQILSTQEFGDIRFTLFKNGRIEVQTSGLR